MGKHDYVPPKYNEGPHGEFFAHRVVRASRQFLQRNPEGGKKTRPSLKAVMAGADHLQKYSGDLPLFEGLPEPKGKHRA